MTSYATIEDVDEKSTIYVLRIAFSFLLGAALLSVAAVLTYIQSGHVAQTYIASLSAIINCIAAYHYNEMIKLRSAQKITILTEWQMDALRHSDWAVTMPMLVLKLYALINNPEQDLLLGGIDASALVATVMVLLGAYSRLGLDEMQSYKSMTLYDKLVGLSFYLLSVVLLVFLLIDLCRSYSGVENTTIVYTFFLVWPLYGVVAIGAAYIRQYVSNPDSYPKNLALVKDCAYAALDVFSKATFAWYTSSAAFGISVLGS